MKASTMLELNKIFDNESQCCASFVNSLKSERTVNIYKIAIYRYMQYLNVSHLQKLIVASEIDVKNNVIKFLMHLKKKGMSYSYRNVILSAVRHFYTMNYEKTIDWKRVAKFLGESTRVHNQVRPYTHEDIQKMINLANIKYKAIILTYASTGFRRSVLPSLKMEDIKQVTSGNVTTYMFTVYPRTQEEHRTFCTPEAFNAINLYLKEREQKGEKLSAKSSLFSVDYDAGNPKPQPLTISAIAEKIRRLSLAAGITTTRTFTDVTKQTGRYRNDIAVLHGFRKFAITEMKRARVDSEIRERMVGHSLGVAGLYMKDSDEDLLSEYLKAINNLTVLKENRLEVNNEKLSAENARLKSKEEEVDKLKIQMQQQQDQMSQLMEMIKFNPRLLEVQTDKLMNVKVHKVNE